jgi:Tfp pilus assembly protein PilX
MKRYLQSKKESGATLIVGLIFLVVMSVIGLSAMSNVSVQEANQW